MKKWCVIAFAVLVISYAFLLFSAAYSNGAEGADGYALLGQSWRLSEAHYQRHFFEPTIASAFVAVLAIYNVVHQLFSPGIPPMSHYHLFAAGLSIVTVLTWVWAFQSLVGIGTAMLLGVLLFSHYLFFGNGAVLVADVFAGFLWAIFFGFFWRIEKLVSPHWVLLGILGAFIATTKYSHFLFLPLFFAGVMIFERKEIPWHGMGISAFAYLFSTELLYRTTGGWSIGVWYPLKQQLLMSKEYLSIGGNARSLAPVLAARRTFYFDDLFYAYGWGVFLLTAAALVLLLVLKKRLHFPMQKKGLIYFGVWLGLVLFHQIVTVKETRYFIPFVPAIALLMATILYQAFSHLSNPLKGVGLFLFVAALFTPVSRILEARVSIRNLAEERHHKEMSELFSFLKKGLVHQKGCEIIYWCDRNEKGLRLDRSVYRVHFPGKQIEVTYCPEEKKSALAMRDFVVGKSLDEMNEEVCFVSGTDAYRPLAIQVTEQEAEDIQRASHSFPERVKCEKTQGAKFDCYLTRRFFAFG